MSSAKYSKGGLKLSQAIEKKGIPKTENKDNDNDSKKEEILDAEAVGLQNGKEPGKKRKKKRKKEKDGASKKSRQSADESKSSEDEMTKASKDGSKFSLSKTKASPSSSSHVTPSSSPLLQPSYLEDADSVCLDESAVEILSSRFISTSNAVVVFVPNGSAFSFKGKLTLTRLTGCLHCLGYVFGKNDSGTHKLYSPDCTSLLTIEDFNDGSSDIDPESFMKLVLERIPEVEGNNDLMTRLREAYVDLSLSTSEEETLSIAPSVAILGKLNDPICDSVTGFSSLFRGLFAEKWSPDKKTVTHLETINSFVMHFPDEDDEGDNDKGQFPGWQRPTIVPSAQWNAIEQMLERNGTDSKSIKLVVVGGKNCGKSTFARIALNALLSARSKETGDLLHPNGVFLLDTDLGQSEFAPSSFISLVHVKSPVLGPPWTHLAKLGLNDVAKEDPLIVRMAFGGGNSPGQAPSLYINAIKWVYDAYVKHPLINQDGKTKPPLIVNTMGWNKGLGVSLMVDLLRIVKPSHVIQLDAESAAKNYPPITNKFVQQNAGWKTRGSSSADQSEHQLISIFSPVGHLSLEGSNKYRPPDMRLMALLAHWFNQDKGGTELKPISAIPPILSVPPFKIALNRLTFHVVHSKVKNSQILYAFNGSLVALGIQQSCSKYPTVAVCNSGEESTDSSATNSSQIPSHDHLPRFFSSPPPPIFGVGLGLVRGIDLDTHHLFLSTFVDEAVLTRVDTLLMGDMELPAEIKKPINTVEMMTTRPVKGGITCDATDISKEINEAAPCPVPYFTVEHKATIGSVGLGSSHKAPMRETGQGHVGRRNDLIKW